MNKNNFFIFLLLPVCCCASSPKKSTNKKKPIQIEELGMKRVNLVEEGAIDFVKFPSSHLELHGAALDQASEKCKGNYLIWGEATNGGYYWFNNPKVLELSLEKNYEYIFFQCTKNDPLSSSIDENSKKDKK